MNLNAHFLLYINFQLLQISCTEYYSPSSINYEDHLIRKRRYLQFPEGSSLQVVYDLVIGVVDYTNYLILGVTVALAWELPTKPPQEILNDINEHLKTGSLILRRNDTHPAHLPSYGANVKDNYFQRTSKPNYSIYSNKKYYKKQVSKGAKGAKGAKGDDHFGGHPHFTPMKHKILPVFGKKNPALHSRHKRSGIEASTLSKWDRIHIRYQRSTRHTLYESIEKYIQGRGSNGHHCVLRALCETGQKLDQDQEPGSFMAEIMRAIFTIPEPLDEDILQSHLPHKEQRYDAASALKTDCSKRYHLCKESLWTSHFIL